MAASIRATFDGIVDAIEERTSTDGADTAVRDYLAHYLSDEHLANPGLGCPIPALGSEIARAPEVLKAEFAANLNRTLAVLEKGLPGPETERHAAAVRELAMRVGAILIARASDAATAKDVLDACREPRAKAQR